MAKVIIKIKMERDEARAIQNFFQFWYMLCNTKKKHPDIAGSIGLQMTWVLLESILAQVEDKFTKRLTGIAQRFIFSFTPAEASAIYTFLMAQPIPADNIWLLTLRQNMIELLQQQIFKR